MKKGIWIAIVLVLALVGQGWAENLYVRPYGSGISTKDGTSYDTAWEGLKNVVWGAGDGKVSAGDTLWVCGTHIDNSTSVDLSTYILTIGESGTDENNRVIIRGDADNAPDEDAHGHPGIIYFVNRLVTSGWTDTGTNNVWMYSEKYGYSYPFEIDGSTIRPYTFSIPLSKTIGCFEQGQVAVDPVNEITITGGPWADDMLVTLHESTLPTGLAKNKFYYLVNVTAVTQTGTFNRDSVSTANNTITLTGGTWADDMKVTVVPTNTADSIPAGLTKDRTYWLVEVDGQTVKFSLTEGGAAVDITGTGALAGGTVFTPQTVQFSLTEGGDPVTITSTGAATFGVVFAAPSATTLGLFSAGDCAQQYHAQGFMAYVKSPSGTSPNTNHTALGNVGNVIVGSSKNYITLKNLTIYSGTISFTACSNINIENVDCYRITGMAIKFIGDCNNNIVDGCDINYCGDGIYLVSSSGVSDNTTIKNCTIDNVLNYWYDNGSIDQHCVGVQGGTGIIVENNTLTTGAYSICQYQGSTGAATCDMIARGNYIKNFHSGWMGKAGVYSVNTPTQKLIDPSINFVTRCSSAVGDTVINRTTGASGTISAISTTINTNDTLEVTLSGGTRQTWLKDDEWETAHVTTTYVGGAGISTQGQSTLTETTLTAYNNIIASGTGPGINATNANHRILNLYNNTIYNCSHGLYCTTYLGALTDLIFKNNIVSGLVTAPLQPTSSFVTLTSSSGYSGSDIIIDYNCYYPNAESDTPFNKDGALSWANWQTGVRTGDLPDANETHYVITDPTFVNPALGTAAGFKLQSTSPAIKAGTNLYTTFTTDYFGKPRPKTVSATKWSIGAHQWQGKIGGVSEPGKVGGVTNYEPGLGK